MRALKVRISGGPCGTYTVRDPGSRVGTPGRSVTRPDGSVWTFTQSPEIYQYPGRLGEGGALRTQKLDRDQPDV